MNKVWTDDGVDFLKLNYGKIDIGEMSNILGYKKSQISQKLNKLKIPNRSWTKDEDDILRQNYPTLQISEFSELLIGRTESSILNRATKLKLKKLVRKEKKNKYEINHNFFSDKNYLSCYWAGFLAADGFIDSEYSRIMLKLSIKDKEHLLRFKQHLNTDSPVRIFDRKSFNKIQTYCQIDIFSNKIKTDLYNNFGLHTKKTFTFVPLHSMSEYESLCFIIGLIDGDGSVCKTKNEKKSITLLGNFEVLKWSKDKISKIVDVSGISILKKKNIYSFTITGDRCDFLRNFVQQNNLPIIKRKWSKI